MSDTPPTSAAAPDQPPAVRIETLIGVLSNLQAWKVLQVLADGSALFSNEIVERCGVPMEAVTRQISKLRAAGVVIAPRGKLYEIAPQFIADKTECILDFGIYVLRLGGANLPTNAN
jgi:predicted transcriptional regulator